LADPRLVLARRELRSLRAEKTIVLALLIQVFVAAFSSFLVVGLVSLYDPGSVDGYTVEVGVVGGEETAGELRAAADETAGLDARRYTDATAARTAFDRGDLDAVVRAERSGGRTTVTALVPDTDVRTTLVVVQLRGALRAYERAERAERTAFLDRDPLALPPAGSASPYYGFTYTVLLPLLLFLPVFLGGSVAVDSVAEERERGTLELLRAAPLSATDVVDGKALAAAGLAPVQAALWMGLLELNGTSVANLPLLLVLVAALSTVVVALAAALSLVAAERRAAQLSYSLGTLVLFGGTTLHANGPVGLAARLALDSAAPGAALVVAGYVAVAVGCYAALRCVVARADLAGA
jgi:ABC-type Na+ efflux pump permease subunit